MIENYRLEQLLAFYECGTLSAAAERLNLTEPSLSRSMRRLEEELGVRLFDRSKNRVVLNEAGQLAVTHARQILSCVEDMTRHLQLFDRSRHTLTIGSCALDPLLELRPRAANLYPALSISSVVVEEGLLQGLRRAEYDLIVLPGPVEEEGLFCRKYRSDQLYLAVLRGHPLANRTSISFAELDGISFIVHPRGDMCTNLLMEKMPHSSFFFHENPDVLVTVAQDPTTPTFTSDIILDNTETVREDQVNIPISDPEGRIVFYLVCREEDRQRWAPLFQNARAPRSH